MNGRFFWWFCTVFLFMSHQAFALRGRWVAVGAVAAHQNDYYRYSDPRGEKNRAIGGMIRSQEKEVARLRTVVAKAEKTLDKAQGKLDALEEKGADEKKITAATKALDRAQKNLDGAMNQKQAAEKKLDELTTKLE